MKNFGYLISILSVLLLAIPAFKSASQDRTLMLCLVAGMAASILGMALRWTAYRREQREKQA